MYTLPINERKKHMNKKKHQLMMLIMLHIKSTDVSTLFDYNLAMDTA